MAHHPPRRHHNFTLLILGIGALAFVLAQTSVIPALGEMQREFEASTSDITWLVSAYLLAASIATPIFGRLGDMFGKERLLAVSLALFAIGSGVSAVADSLGVMIAGRALQGLGGGVFPLSFGIIRDEFPREKVPTGIALLGAIAAIGGGIGLPLGGVLVDEAGFQWIFWMSVVMGVLATVTTYLFVPESPVRTPGRVDFAGAAILAAGLTALLVAISRAGQWGWGSVETLGLIAAGLVLLVAFVRFERAQNEPLINMQTLGKPSVLTTNIATLLVGFGLFGTFILVPQLAGLPEGGEIGLGLTATEAGLLLAPGSLVALLIAPFVGRLGERIGSKLPLLAGCAIAAAALVGMAFAHDSTDVLILWSCILSIGVGAAFAAIPNLIVDAVDEHETGEATGVNTIMRNVGAALGSQVAGSIVAGHVLQNGLPQDVGFEIAFLMGAAGAVAAALCVLLIPGRLLQPTRRRRAGAGPEHCRLNPPLRSR